MKKSILRTTCMLLTVSTLAISPAAFSQSAPTLVPGSVFFYESISEEYDNSRFFQIFLGSVGPWNLYMQRFDFGESAYFAETQYALDYVDCEGEEITSPEDLAADMAALEALPHGEVMERVNGTETVQAVGPLNYTSDFLPDETFEAYQIKIASNEDGETFETLFTNTVDGEIILEMDWGDGNIDFLSYYSIAVNPAPPLTRERLEDLCPSLLQYFSEG